MVKKINYENGKIYTITSPNHEKCYVGSSTKEPICQRLGEHIAKYRNYVEKKGVRYTSSFEILEAGDAIITTHEVFPCKSKGELLAREQYWIDRLDCVNQIKAFRTEEDLLNDKKKFNRAGTELAKKYNKDYYQKNKGTLLQKNAIYREANKDEINKRRRDKAAVTEKSESQKKKHNEANKKWRAENKEKIKEYGRQYRLEKKLEKEQNQ